MSLFSPRFCNSNNFLLRLKPVLLLNCIYWNCKLYHFSWVQQLIFTSEPSKNKWTTDDIKCSSKISGQSGLTFHFNKIDNSFWYPSNGSSIYSFIYTPNCSKQRSTKWSYPVDPTVRIWVVLDGTVRGSLARIDENKRKSISSHFDLILLSYN